MKYLLIFIILLAGCRCPKPIATVEKETVTITETVRDTVVKIQPDASHIRALLECDDERQVIIRELQELQAGNHVRPPQIVIRENVLTATAEVDSFEVYLKWKQRDRQTDVIKTETVTVNELTGWQWFQIWAGRIAFALALIWIFYKRFKTYLK
jgi:hypothetical protein